MKLPTHKDVAFGSGVLLAVFHAIASIVCLVVGLLALEKDCDEGRVLWMIGVGAGNIVLVVAIVCSQLVVALVTDNTRDDKTYCCGCCGTPVVFVCYVVGAVFFFDGEPSKRECEMVEEYGFAIHVMYFTLLGACLLAWIVSLVNDRRTRRPVPDEERAEEEV